MSVHLHLNNTISTQQIFILQLSQKLYRMNYQRTFIASFMTAACIVIFSQCNNDSSESKNSKVIGTAGGTVASNDNNLTVAIPEGIFDQNTKVTVNSASSNENPNGVGTMYSIESDVKQFDKPVQLTFHYADNALSNGNIAELLTISYREDGGPWKIQPNAQLNTTDKSLKVSTNHFSDWTVSLLDSGYIDIAIPEDTLYLNIPNYYYQNVNKDVDQQYSDSLNILFQPQQEQIGIRAGLDKNGMYDPVTANTPVDMGLYIYSNQTLLYSGTVPVTFSSISVTPGDIVGGTFSGTVERVADKHSIELSGKFYFKIK
jgi:hypothetical protein